MPAERKPRNQNLTVPNALSVLRIIIVPFFAWFFLKENLVAAVGLLALSGLSDMFDGMIARRFNQITELGKMLDPFADKLTQGVVALCLAIKFPAICPVLLIFIVKELAMLCCAIILLKKKKRPCAAMWYGKVATVMFYLSVSVIVIMDGFFQVKTLVFDVVSNILLLLTAVMMLYSAFKYFQIFREILHSDDEKYELDLPDEIRAKTVREKTRRNTVSYTHLLKSLKPILFIIVFTAVLNIFYGSGDPLVQLGWLKITLSGILNSVFVSIRIVTLILASSVLTFTTSPTQLTDAIERLLRPLAKLHVPVHEFAMMMTIALRFVPTLLEETDKIMSAQKARGADMESGGIVQRIKALVPVLIPLFVSAFRRAYDLATAMESRCYHGGEGRTKMKILKFGHTDWVVLVFAVLALGLFITANILIPPVL